MANSNSSSSYNLLDERVYTGSRNNTFMRSHGTIEARQYIIHHGIDILFDNNPGNHAHELTFLSFPTLQFQYDNSDGTTTFKYFKYKFLWLFKEMSDQIFKDPTALANHLNYQFNCMKKFGSRLYDDFKAEDIHPATKVFLEKYAQISPFSTKEAAKIARQCSVYTNKNKSLVQGLSEALPVIDALTDVSLSYGEIKDRLSSYIPGFHRKHKVTRFLINAASMKAYSDTAQVFSIDRNEKYRETTVNGLTVRNSFSFTSLAVDKHKAYEFECYIASICNVICKEMVRVVRHQENPIDYIVHYMYYNFGVDVNIVNQLLVYLSESVTSAKEIAQKFTMSLRIEIAEQLATVVPFAMNTEVASKKLEDRLLYIKESDACKYLVKYISIFSSDLTLFKQLISDTYDFLVGNIGIEDSDKYKLFLGMLFYHFRELLKKSKSILYFVEKTMCKFLKLGSEKLEKYTTIIDFTLPVSA